MYGLIALYGVIVLLPFLDNGAVLSRHEVLAAEPAREMRAGAPWSVQTFAGELRTAKQPTMSWLIAASMTLFDSRGTFACRLPAAIAGILVALAVASIGADLFDRQHGLFAGLITLTTYWLQMQSRLSEADMPLTAAVAVAMAVLAKAIVGKSRIGLLSVSFYLAAGVAFMLKAPGVLVPLSAAGIYAWRAKDTRVKSMLMHPIGVATFLVLFLCWPIVVLVHHHDMLGVWWREIGQRSAGQFGREKPTTLLSYLIDLPFYFWISPILLLPATPAIAIGAIAAWRNWEAKRLLFVFAWVLPWLLLLTLLPLAKAKHYILPALPALSLVGAFGSIVWMRRFKSVSLGRSAVAVWFVGVAVAILLVQALILPKFNDYEPSADLGRRASALLPVGERAVLLGLGEAHVAFYLDPIPRRIDAVKDLPANGRLFVVSDRKTLGKVDGKFNILAEAKALRKGEVEDDRLIFAVVDP